MEYILRLICSKNSSFAGVFLGVQKLWTPPLSLCFVIFVLKFYDVSKQSFLASIWWRWFNVLCPPCTCEFISESLKFIMCSVFFFNQFQLSLHFFEFSLLFKEILFKIHCFFPLTSWFLIAIAMSVWFVIFVSEFRQLLVMILVIIYQSIELKCSF